MKTALIGADGQLGCDLLKLDPTLTPLTIKDLNVTRADEAETVLQEINPQVIINTSAFHRVDDCEDDPAPAFAVNTYGARNLALIAKKIGAALVHISTDYVFSGDKKTPYSETDPADPQSVYGISKLAGEKMIEYLLPEHFIVRSSGLYGTAGCLEKGKTNFVESMIGRAEKRQPLKVVDDEILTPTYTLDLAKKILEIIPRRSYGLYHITNSGECSWYQFTKKIFELLKMKVDLSPTTGDQFKSKAKRPKYSVLRHDHLKHLGLENLRSWEEALKAYLKEKGRLK
ncbi:dTDP-4-dehydrorhamnose reductase [Candidatus Saganbacteria bacterium]|nr:dTDP-4-dehydrorhamnose reductase [Candidatus Saganbacteria bacterium]